MTNDAENRKSDISKYATIRIVEKCVDNARRLYEDAWSTSFPTHVALMEIGIEELSKAMILFQYFPDDSPERQNFLKALDGGIEFRLRFLIINGGDYIFNFHKNFEFDSKDLADHVLKPQVIKNIFKYTAKVYLLLEKILLDNSDSPYRRTSRGSERKFNGVREIISKLNDKTIEKWDQVKERAFYVYPEEGCAPIDEVFDNTRDLMWGFDVMYLTMMIFLKFSKGAKLEDLSYVDILKFFFDLQALVNKDPDSRSVH